jgi:hypothetical protein
VELDRIRDPVAQGHARETGREGEEEPSTFHGRTVGRPARASGKRPPDAPEPFGALRDDCVL